MSERDTSIISLTPGIKLSFTYTNWRGEMEGRVVEVHGVWWGATKWHPKPQWLLSARDLKKSEMRDFAMADMADVMEVR